MTSTNIPELQLRNGGAVRLSSDISGIAAIGGTSLPTAKKGLLIAIDHRGHPTDDETSGAPPFKGLLRLPSKIPEALVRKGSRSQPLPPYGWPYVDMDGEDQVDIDKWTWKEVGIDLAGHEGSFSPKFRERCIAHARSYPRRYCSVPGNQDDTCLYRHHYLG
jgi:hypothetical protein